MTQQHRLVGIIEIDADPNLDTRVDGTLGEALRTLRSVPSNASEAGIPPATDSWALDDEPVESVKFLVANLDQLTTELESELVRLVDRLLATM